MTTEKKNGLLTNIQTALLSLGVLAGTSCFGFLWHINTVLTHQADKEIQYDNDIHDLRENTNDLNAEYLDHEKRITRLETRGEQKQ